MLGYVGTVIVAPINADGPLSQPTALARCCNRHGAAKQVSANIPKGVILGLVPRTQRAAVFVVRSERVAAGNSHCRRLHPRFTLGPRDKPEDDGGREESAVVTGGCAELGP
jgi:hypothetical protein